MCDTLVSVDRGRVLFAKSSDRDATEPQHLEWGAAAEHAPGARVSCTHLAIPQAPRTHAVLLSRPYWMWGAEIGTNEHGVTIGNEAVFTKERVPREGLTGMDLLRLALERAASADEAVETIVRLIDAHGQGGGCGHEDRAFRYFSSFIVADGSGAIVLETAGERAWATERVTSGGRSISNGLTIPAFARAHSDVLKTAVSACRVRRPRTEAAARRARGPEDLARALRDHGEDPDDGSRDLAWPIYSPLTGGMRAPCMHAGGLVASSQTTASWVAELAPGEARHWATGTSAPCLSVFKPVRVEEPVRVLGDGPPRAEPDGSLWWRAERLHRAVMRDPARLAPAFLGERDAMERGFFADRPPSAEAFAAHDAALARWTARALADAGARDVRPAWARRYWRAREPARW